MPNQNRLLQVERSHDGKHIVAETVGRIILVIGRRVAGLAEAATGDAVDVVFARELWCEAVVYMHCVAQPGEENERASAATPIEHFELDARLDGDELHLVWRRIGRKRPRCLFGGLSEGKRGSAALDPRASDGVAVGAELAFVGEPDQI